MHCVRALVLWDQSVRDMPVPSNACVTNFLFLVSWLMVMPKAASQVLVRLTCGMRCRWKITIGMRLMSPGTTRSWREQTITRKFLEVRAISGSCWGRMTRLLLASPLLSRIPIPQQVTILIRVGGNSCLLRRLPIRVMSPVVVVVLQKSLLLPMRM